MSISYREQGTVAVLSLDRPDKLNAINAAMIGELHDALDRAEASDTVCVILLRGEGRAFSAGFDMEVDAPPESDPEAFWREELQKDFNIIMRFWDSPKVTLAAVHGYCLGSAMEMDLACDLTVASDDCRFGIPEVGFGSGIVAMLLPWLAPAKLAKEILLTADKHLPAARLEALGLVNRVVPADQLLDTAVALAEQVAGNDRNALRLTKQAINESYRIMGMPEALVRSLELDVEIEAAATRAQRAGAHPVNKENP
jgi:enoyl-CoA hydratase